MSEAFEELEFDQQGCIFGRTLFDLKDTVYDEGNLCL